MDIDKKVCANVTGHTTTNADVCRHHTPNGNGSQRLSALGEKISKDKSKWPDHKSGTSGKGLKTNSENMADGHSGLQRTGKNKVAGLLSKTISGGEVVEISSVSTTSVMLNSCYDLQSEGFSVAGHNRC